MTPEAAIANALTGGQDTAGSVGDQVATLMAAAGGSPGRAAALAGIPGRTWRYIRSGTRQPSAATRQKLTAAVRQLQVPPDRRAWLRRKGHHGPQVVISGEIVVSNDSRTRSIFLTGWPRLPDRPAADQVDGVMGRVLDAWLTGDDTAALAALVRPIEAGVGDQGVTLRQLSHIKLFTKASHAHRAVATIPPIGDNNS